MKNKVKNFGNVRWNITFSFERIQRSNWIERRRNFVLTVEQNFKRRHSPLRKFRPNKKNQFERKASQRFSRRASYAIRKKISEKEIQREQEEERVKLLKIDQQTQLISNGKHLSLSAAQRLDNLIQESNEIHSKFILHSII